MAVSRASSESPCDAAGPTTTEHELAKEQKTTNPQWWSNGSARVAHPAYDVQQERLRTCAPDRAVFSYVVDPACARLSETRLTGACDVKWQEPARAGVDEICNVTGGGAETCVRASLELPPLQRLHCNRASPCRRLAHSRTSSISFFFLFFLFLMDMRSGTLT